MFNSYESINRFSEEGILLWKKKCDDFIATIDGTNIHVCLIKAYYPEYFIKKDNNSKVLLNGKTLSKIKTVNMMLKECYLYLTTKMACDVITLEDEKLTDFVKQDCGINLSVNSSDYEQAVAYKLTTLYNIQDSLVKTSFDRIQTLFEIFDPLLKSGEVPSISELLHEGKTYLRNGFGTEAKKCEKLIQILHNSSVPLSVILGKGVSFGYGGIGTICHAKAIIGNYVVIGSNVTIGGGKTNINSSGLQQNVPIIEDRIYIATGSKILGGITIGHHSIIGAYAVVTKDIPPYSVVAGNPSKIIATITQDNCEKYTSYFYKGIGIEDVKILMFDLSKNN